MPGLAPGLTAIGVSGRPTLLRNSDAWNDFLGRPVREVNKTNQV
jgi:hypothetical protein